MKSKNTTNNKTDMDITKHHQDQTEMDIINSIKTKQR